MSESTVVARIGKPHGLLGEVTVQLHTDEPERRLAAHSGLNDAVEAVEDLGSILGGDAGAIVADHQHDLLVVAARVGPTRLIDNVVLHPQRKS